MPSVKRNIFILISIIVIISTILACNLPGQSSYVEREAIGTIHPEELEIIEQESITQDFASFIDQLIAEPQVALLMDELQARGYQEIVAAERTALNNGTQLRSIALSGSTDQQIILTLIEEQDGANGAHVLEFPSDDSMVIWDQSGRLEFTYRADGSADLNLKDSDGNPFNGESSTLYPSAKLACQSPVSSVGCEKGFINELYACVGGIYATAAMGATCVSLLPKALAACAASGGGLCIPAGVGALLTCGYPFYCVAASIVDNKPEVVFKEPRSIRTYLECGENENELWSRTEYQIDVDCIDDRDPITPPDPLIVSSLPYTELIYASCKDCSGQETRDATTVSVADVIKCVDGCDANNSNWCETLDGERLFADNASGQTENLDSDSFFSGAWFSSQNCDAEFPYTWSVSLNQNTDGSVNGTIRFCKPGSGYMVYSVAGQAEPGKDSIQLEGRKLSGDGEIFNGGPTIQTFVFKVSNPQDAPSPNLSR